MVRPADARHQGEGSCPSPHDRNRGKAGDVRLDTEIRSVRMPLCMEDIHGVGGSGTDSKSGGLGIEVDHAKRGVMKAAQVEGELLVDEDPHVIVAAEGEFLTFHVPELQVDLCGEVIILAVCRLAKSLVGTEGKEAGAIENVLA